MSTISIHPYARSHLEHIPSFVCKAESLTQRVSAWVCHVFAMMRSAVATIFPCFAAQKIKPSPCSYGVSHHIKQLNQTPYCIFSVDGGGVRGVIPLKVASMVEKLVGKKIAEVFDCLAGTSTGGIIAGGLSAPSKENPREIRYWAEDLLGLYRTFAEKVFASTYLQRLNPLWGAFSAKYANPREIVENLIGDCRMADLVAKRTQITSYELPRKLVVFENSLDDNTKLSDVLLATSAAPTYFDPVLINGKYHIDGGVARNNPAAIAVLKALEEDPTRPVFIFSVGTGKVPDEVLDKEEPRSGGKIQWVGPLIDILIDASGEEVCQALQRLAKTYPQITYIRFQVELTDSGEMELDNADPANLQHLQDLAEKAFQDYLNHGGQAALIDLLKNKISALG